MLRWIGYVVTAAILLAGCQSEDPEEAEPTPETPAKQTPSTDTTTPDTTTPDATPTPDSTPSARQQPARFRAANAHETVRWLAGDIGPREATSPEYRQAARRVAKRLRDLGYDVDRQVFQVPAGESWGVPVSRGRAWNVVATPPDFEPTRPHLLVGAHLDTVAAAPGAEDNASGVAVTLELARLSARDDTRRPVVFVAFGAEEPRGDGDDMHHFGSQTMVRRFSDERRDAVQAMVALDRVGVGEVMPVCTGGAGPLVVRRTLLEAGREAGVPAQSCADNRASDHWSFEKAGLPAARLGSTPYDAYHSAADRPGVINRTQLARAGRLMWAWLSG